MKSKMSMNDRARIFLPFDAMKGLQAALRAAEFENESVLHHRLSDDEARRISAILSNLDENCRLFVKYFEDGHYYECQGDASLDAYESLLEINDKKIPLHDIYDLQALDQ